MLLKFFYEVFVLLENCKLLLPKIMGENAPACSARMLSLDPHL